jgi:class 3 adenylate cyclase
MGAAVSGSISSLPSRRRSSRGSRGSRTSLLRSTAFILNPIDDQQAQPPQRRLCDTPSSTSTPHDAKANHTNQNTDADSTTTTTKEAAQEPSAQIVRDRRANSNTVNSVHANPWSTQAGMGPFNESPVALTTTADAPSLTTAPSPPPSPPPTPLLPPPPPPLASSQPPQPQQRQPRRRQSSLKSCVNIIPRHQGSESEVDVLLKTEIEDCLARSAPTTAMRRGSPKLPVSRPLQCADIVTFNETFSNLATTKENHHSNVFSPPPPPLPGGFSPWGLRRVGSLSSTDQNKAIIATSNFKATYQRFFEEPRSRGNSTATITTATTTSANVKGVTANDSVDGRSSREDPRTNSTQLSTDEWSHLLDLLDIGNTLISVDDELQRSQDKEKVDFLLAYPATDVTPEAQQQRQQRQLQTPLLPPNASTTTDDVTFTPLRLRFSTTGSFSSGPASAELDLPRAISGVDTYAANMRRLLTTWQHIVHDHSDAFIADLGAVLSQKHAMHSTLPPTPSAEEQARAMLGMIGQAVQLVSQMEDMYAVLLEMGAMHRRHGVGADHFEALHQSFMQVLPRYLPAEQHSSLCVTVWEQFWQTMVRLLTQGNVSERGGWYAAQRRAEWLAEARAVLKVLSEQQQAANYRGTFIPSMLDRAEAANPAMSQFSLMREPRAAIRSFKGLVSLALEVDSDKERAQLIEQLAHEHIVYGLSEWGLRELRQPFIDVAEHFVKLSGQQEEVWTSTAAESLGLFWDMLTEHWVEGIAVSRRSLADIKGLRAPSGSRPFCMMFTDIEAGTRLWELHPSMMADAVDAHNRIIRKLIADHDAYEVKTDGDSFVIATRDVFAALQIAVSTQLELMRGPIVEGFQMVPVTQGGGLTSCWRSDSLRVRIGIHYCTDASAVYDSVQRRFDYYGPSVNCASRVAAAAAGGQILITQAAVNALRASRDEHGAQEPESPMPIAEIAPGSNPMETVLDSLLEFQWWGAQRFRGINEAISVYSVLPMRLSGRTFPYYVGNRKVRVSAPSEIAGRKEVHRLSLTQLKTGNLDASTNALFRP